MKILAIDPGITTGVAVVSDEGAQVTLERSAALPVERLSEVMDLALQVDAVVIEPVPIQPGGRLSRDLSRVMGMLEFWFPDAVKIGPGVWKPVAGSYINVPDFRTPHERDAYCLGRYFITKQLLKEERV